MESGNGFTGLKEYGFGVKDTISGNKQPNLHINVALILVK